jgi:hypothetical protein
MLERRPAWLHGTLRDRVGPCVSPVVAILSLATGVGCDAGKYPYDTPPSGVSGDQAVALFRRQAEWRGVTRSLPNAEKVETKAPSGDDAWLIRLSSDVDSRALCGYVWRGEEAGRADSTAIFIRFDAGCRHWHE